MKTAEERYEETWNNYLELLNKDPRASLVSFTKLKSVVLSRHDQMDVAQWA